MQERWLTLVPAQGPLRNKYEFETECEAECETENKTICETGYETVFKI